MRTSWKGVEYAGHGHQAGKRPHNLYDAAGKRYASDVPVTWVNAAKDETRIFVTPAATNIYGTAQDSGAMQFTDISNPGPSATMFYIGGPSGGQRLRGTVKNFRHYDRVLTDAELKRNRQVDSARYFGELAFTNVVVEVAEGLDAVATPAPGAYAVEGSYTFSCEAGTDTLSGYKLETWDASSGTWTDGCNVESFSYAYDAATSPSMVRITWRKFNPLVIVMR